MAKKPLPTPEVLRQLLRYEPETGKLFWKERGPEWFSDEQGRQRNAQSIFNSLYAGREAFTNVAPTGYKNGGIFRKTYLAHRVIWAIYHGAWPADQIDHINGLRTDNRIINLRAATSAENAKNARSSRASGLRGASKHSQCNRWTAQINHNGKHIYIGLFATEIEAHAAYVEYAKRLHGDFARLE